MTLRVLITGAGGFVGPYVAARLRHDFGDRVEIYSFSRSGGSARAAGTEYSLDVTDFIAARRTIERIRPTHVVHLAGVASIQNAVANAEIAWKVHLFGALNIAQAVVQCVPDSIFLYVGSGQVYGASAQSGHPLDEATLLAPTNVYTASKAAADLAVGSMVGSGLRSIRFRPFNHTGPNQSEDFALPSFAMQIARIKAGLQEPVLRVGNLAVERDFLDVRDVAAAYVRAVAMSEEIEPGTIFNIASGVPYRMDSLLTRLIELSGAKIEVETDQRRLRAGDIPRFVGDATRAKKLLKWEPQCSLENTLRELLEHSERSVAKTLAARC